MDSRTFGLLRKYDVPVPRYTSYPTVPYWEPETLQSNSWQGSVRSTFESTKGEVSLYIHLPYCESLCSFCACNKRITKDHRVEDPYIEALLSEWRLYTELLPSKPRLVEVHLGGGTPTFFSPQNLERLVRGLLKSAEPAAERQWSVEVHPNVTTRDHIATLSDLGFRRISLGVQDFDPQVQRVINRVQSVEQTKLVCDWARELGFQSVNVDLVYGLPHQTTSSVELTMAALEPLRPDRFAYYSYAHVPWKSKIQRLYTEEDLPSADQKWEMVQCCLSLMEGQGYLPIGMDHFALPDDPLFQSAAKGELHRNFMGYTTKPSPLLIGLGASSISDSYLAFVQNEKSIDLYEQRVRAGEWPQITGHVLDPEDLLLRGQILNLMCRQRTVVPWDALEPPFRAAALAKLASLEADELVELHGDEIRVTALGKLFVRNISSPLDARLWRKQRRENQFSRSI